MRIACWMIYLERPFTMFGNVESIISMAIYQRSVERFKNASVFILASTASALFFVCDDLI